MITTTKTVVIPFVSGINSTVSVAIDYKELLHDISRNSLR